jgi:hypothetical protein
MDVADLEARLIGNGGSDGYGGGGVRVGSGGSSRPHTPSRLDPLREVPRSVPSKQDPKLPPRKNPLFHSQSNFELHSKAARTVL